MRATSLALMLVVVPLLAEAQTKPRFISVNWTVQSRINGKTYPGYRIFDLSCSEFSCDLRVVDVNHCTALDPSKPKELSHLPTSITYSREAKELVVVDLGQEVLLTVDVGNGKQTHRLQLDPDPSAFHKLVAYKGAWLDNSATVTEFVPIVGDEKYVTRRVDCPLALPSVKRPKK